MTYSAIFGCTRQGRYERDPRSMVFALYTFLALPLSPLSIKMSDIPLPSVIPTLKSSMNVKSAKGFGPTTF